MTYLPFLTNVSTVSLFNFITNLVQFITRNVHMIKALPLHWLTCPVSDLEYQGLRQSIKKNITVEINTLEEYIIFYTENKISCGLSLIIIKLEII